MLNVNDHLINPDMRLCSNNFCDSHKLKDVYVTSDDMYDRVCYSIPYDADVNIYINDELMPKEVPKVEIDWDKVANTYRKNRDSWIEMIKNKKME